MDENWQMTDRTKLPILCVQLPKSHGQAEMACFTK